MAKTADNSFHVWYNKLASVLCKTDACDLIYIVTALGKTRDIERLIRRIHMEKNYIIGVILLIVHVAILATIVCMYPFHTLLCAIIVICFNLYQYQKQSP